MLVTVVRAARATIEAGRKALGGMVGRPTVQPTDQKVLLVANHQGGERGEGGVDASERAI